MTLSIIAITKSINDFTKELILNVDEACLKLFNLEPELIMMTFLLVILGDF